MRSLEPHASFFPFNDLNFAVWAATGSSAERSILPGRAWLVPVELSDTNCVECLVALKSSSLLIGADPDLVKMESPSSIMGHAGPEECDGMRSRDSTVPLSSMLLSILRFSFLKFRCDNLLWFPSEVTRQPSDFLPSICTFGMFAPRGRGCEI